MTEQQEHSCEHCEFRRKAETSPRSLLGILWKLHTYVCPGWRAYQRTLSRAGHGADD